MIFVSSNLSIHLINALNSLSSALLLMINEMVFFVKIFTSPLMYKSVEDLPLIESDNQNRMELYALYSYS